MLEVFSFIAFTVANTYTQSQVDGFVTSLGGTNTPWVSYTPTYSGLTIGNATVDAKYKQIGKTVIGRVNVKLGSTSSVTGTIAISPPITPIVGTNYSYNCNLVDAGTAYYVGHAVYEGTRFTIFAVGTGATYATVPNTSSTVPFTWTTNDEIFLTFTYEVA